MPGRSPADVARAIGAAAFTPAVACIVVPSGVLAANVDEIAHASSLLWLAIGAFCTLSALLAPAFLCGLRCKPLAFLARPLMAGGLCILCWRFLDGIGIGGSEVQASPPWLQTSLDLAASAFVLAVALRMALPNLYAITSAMSLCLLASSAISHPELWQRALRAPQAEPSVHVATAQAVPAFRGNVYHLLLDGFQGDLYPSAAQSSALPAGFTFFPGFTTNADRTFWSNAILLRGSPLPDFDRESPPEWAQRSYQEGFWTDLAAGGVKIHLYPHYPYYCLEHAQTCRTSVDLIQSKEKIVAVDLCFLGLLPRSVQLALAPPGETNTGVAAGADTWAYGFSITSFLTELSGVDPLHVPAYSVHNFENLLRDEVSRPPTGQYVFAHLIVPHGPLVLDSRCSYQGERDSTTGILPMHQCAMHLVERLTERLDALDRLASALIVVHSDHGTFWDARQLGALLQLPDSGQREPSVSPNESDSAAWPSDMIEARSSGLLLVKAPDSEESSVSEALVQTIDIAPTVLQGFGLPAEKYAGRAVQSGQMQAQSSRFFFGTNRKPDGNWPAVFSEYVYRDGAWSFQRNLLTGR